MKKGRLTRDFMAKNPIIQAILRLKFLYRQFIIGHMPRILGLDRKSVVKHARQIGIENFDFSKREYKRLRDLEKKMYLDSNLIAEFDKDYKFMHRCPMLMRIGRFNSITGMCYDIAVKKYAEIGRIAEKARRDFIEEPIEDL